MAEENLTEHAQFGDTRFGIQKIYLKDCSFETPNSPRIFSKEWEPEVSLELRNTAKKLSQDMHEVVLSLTVTAKLAEKTAYLVEVQQAGIFLIQGFNEADLNAMVGSYCPNLLFPYAREAVSNFVSKGGFPSFYLAPVNFDALYTQHVESAKGTEPPPKSAH